MQCGYCRRPPTPPPSPDHDPLVCLSLSLSLEPPPGKRSSLLQRPTSEYAQETSNLRGLRGKGLGDGGGGGGARAMGGGGGRAEAPTPEMAGGGGGIESAGSDTASAASDINYMHESLRQYHPEEGCDEEGEGGVGVLPLRSGSWCVFAFTEVNRPTNENTSAG